MTFWDHLDELRNCLIKALAAVFVAGIVAFCFKDTVFSVVFAPSHPDFVTYRLFDKVARQSTSFEVKMINIELAQQFLTHIKISLWVGLLAVSPYLLYLLFGFVAPGLYDQERRYAVAGVLGGYLMFLAGILINYFIIFPFTFRFLGTYQVSAEVLNQISLQNYISSLLMLCFMMGVVFELPILCWLLAKMGILHSDMMKRYRRHAIVAILILAAVITPSGDAFTLTLVALPIYLLYEVGLLLVRRVEAGRRRG